MPTATYSSETFFIFDCGTNFSKTLSKLEGLVLPEGLGILIEIIQFIASRTRDLLACSRVHYPLC
jgi:hypothetical protein